MQGSKQQVSNFLDKSFQEQVKTIIKIGDLRSLQALIGVRNAAALSRYYASFFVTKINIMYAKHQGTLKVYEKLLEKYLDKITKEGWVPAQVIQHSDNMFKDCISESECELLKEVNFLPTINDNKSAIGGNKLSNLSAYVRETNIESLCTMDDRQITEIHKHFVENSHIEEELKLDLKNKTPREAVVFLAQKEKILEAQLKPLEGEIRSYEDVLNKIKQGLFLGSWHKRLVYQVLEEALANEGHPFHGEANHYYKANSGVLSEHSKDSIMKDLRTLWNKELVRRTLEKIVQKKGVVITNEDYRKEAIQGLLESINLWSEYIVDSASRGFELIRELYGDYSINDKLESTDDVKRYIVKEFSAALLIEEEQSVLREMLLYAIEQKQNDIALLLICNEVDHEGCKVNLPKELAPLEIKRLYKDMPKMIYKDIPKPVLSLKEIKEYFPDEDVMKQIASCILEQEERLTVGTPESTEEEKRKLVNENIEKILDEYPFYIVWYYRLKTKKSKLEKVERALSVAQELDKSFEESAGYASAEPFLKELGVIEKKDDVRLNREFFKRLRKIRNDKSGNMLTFEELVKEIIDSKREHIDKEKVKAAVKSSTVDVFEENINRGLKILDLEGELKKSNAQNQGIATRLTLAEAKTEEERAAKEQERAAREEAEAKAEEAEAENKARDMVADEVDEREISFKKVNIKGAREFFIAQFKLVVLYESLKDKFQDQADKCAQLRKELADCEIIVDRAVENSKEMSKEDIFERKLGLINEFEKLNKKMAKLNEEYAQEKPEFDNEKVTEFKDDILTKVVQAKEEAENFKQRLQQELEKLQKLEEEKLQMQAEDLLDSNISKAEIQSHQNITSKIA